MKKVFQNSMVAHIWAQQEQEEGRSNNGQFYFNGPTIYSYGSHWPLATFIDGGSRVLINNDHYGVTTSKHAGYVRQAIRGSVEKIYVSCNVLREFQWDKTFNDSCQRETVNAAIAAAQTQIANAKQKKAAKYKANNIRTAKQIVDDALNIFLAFNIKYPEKLTALRDTLCADDINALLAADDERIEAKRLAAEKEAKLKQAKIKNFMEKWWIKNELPPENQGYTVFSPYSSSKIYMRINGENIETSRGATFPIEHAKRVFALVRNCHDGKFTWIRDQIDERVLKRLETTLGHFRVDKIDEHGNVKAGCHYVEWDEIERCAVELEIYP